MKVVKHLHYQSILYARHFDGDDYVVCDKLEKIRIPASVKKIDYNAYQAGDYHERFDIGKDIVISGSRLRWRKCVNLCNRTNLSTWENIAKQVQVSKLRMECIFQRTTF